MTDVEEEYNAKKADYDKIVNDMDNEKE